MLGSLHAILDIDHIVHETVHHQRSSVPFHHQRVQVVVQQLVVSLVLLLQRLQQLALPVNIH